MHLKRLTTALVVLPLFVLLIYKGSSILFAVFVCLAGLLALKEYYAISYQTLGLSEQGWITALGFISAPLLLFAAYSNAPGAMVGIIVVNLVLSVFISLIRITSVPGGLDVAIRHVLGIIYVPGLMSYLIFIRNGPGGINWLFFLFSVVFVGDSAAFYGGTLFGKHKLIPSVSPGKTLEGSVAGILAGVGAGLLCKFIFNLPVSSGACVLLSLAVEITAQIGDLFESQLKRAAKIKDSGGILPGHGGVLDRIDATLFAAPVLYLARGYFL